MSVVSSEDDIKNKPMTIFIICLEAELVENCQFFLVLDRYYILGTHL